MLMGRLYCNYRLDSTKDKTIGLETALEFETPSRASGDAMK